MKRMLTAVSIRTDTGREALFDPCGSSIVDFLKRLEAAYADAGYPFGDNDEGLAMWIRFRSRTTGS